MKARSPYPQIQDKIPGSVYLQIGLLLGFFAGGLIGLATGLLFGSIIR